MTRRLAAALAITSGLVAAYPVEAQVDWLRKYPHRDMVREPRMHVPPVERPTREEVLLTIAVALAAEPRCKWSVDGAGLRASLAVNKVDGGEAREFTERGRAIARTLIDGSICSLLFDQLGPDGVYVRGVLAQAP